MRVPDSSDGGVDATEEIEVERTRTTVIRDGERDEANQTDLFLVGEPSLSSSFLCTCC